MAKNAVLITIAVIAVGVAVYRFTSAKPTSFRPPDTIGVDGVCLNCKQEVHVDVPAREPTPWVCPACGERAVYTWMYCGECQYRFVPNLIPGAEGYPVPPQVKTCTHCGCQKVGAYDPDSTIQSPVGDAKLPKWTPPAGG